MGRVLILQKGNTLLHSNTFMFFNLLVCKIKDFPIELGLNMKIVDLFCQGVYKLGISLLEGTLNITNLFGSIAL